MTTTIALAGNPNVGKSSLFNALTGSHQHVGNWPGKTVEKKEGNLTIENEKFLLVDLPGTYSLTAYSIEEIIARDFIINERPSAIIAVVDAANLERNLYFVAQLIELEIPVIIALNMTDVAQARGMTISIQDLSTRFGGIPVIKTVGNRSIGIEELKLAIHDLSRDPKPPAIGSHYSGPLTLEFEALRKQIRADKKLSAIYQASWLATKLLEEDAAVIEQLKAGGSSTVLAAAIEARKRIESKTGEDAETLIVDHRYAHVSAIVKSVLKRPAGNEVTFSDKLDKFVTHRIWGLPIFMLMMWIIFQFTANVSTPFLNWIDGFVNQRIVSWLNVLLPKLGLDGTWLHSLITDGVVAGVGGVLVFVPVLLFLYMALSLLEDSGYMARAAFVMDRVMRWMGLHGKSFLPMIVGFGCTVPAVYATRTLASEKDRKLTGFLATFMSCGARLPVYVVFGAAFFGTLSGNLIFAMYILGILVALATGLVLKRTIYKGSPPAPFVMELPPYRLPRPRDVWRQMWERTEGFLVKAGTVIFAVSIILWLLMAIPVDNQVSDFNEVAPSESLFGYASGKIAPIFAPAGFDSWQASGSLITGLVAKEIIVGTMNQIYVGEDSQVSPILAASEEFDFAQELGDAALSFGEAGILTLQELVNILPRTLNLIPLVAIPELDFLAHEALAEDDSRIQSTLVSSFAASAGSPAAGPIAAVAFNVFVLLYIPCMAAVAAMRHEFGARWMWAQIIYTFAIAWIASTLTFQLGKIFFL